MKCKKCDFSGTPNLAEAGPNTKATCPECGSYIKMASNKELSAIFSANPSMCYSKGEEELVKYSSTSDMIKAGIKAGFRHIGGKGYLCRICGDDDTARKFRKGNEVLFACNLCGGRY